MNDIVQDLLAVSFFGNSALAYLLGVGYIFLGFFVVKMIELNIIRRLKQVADGTATSVDDFVIMLMRKIGVTFAYCLIVYCSVKSLALSEKVLKVLDVLVAGAITFFVMRLLILLIDYCFSVYWKKQGKDLVLERSLNGIVRVVKIVLWGVAISFFLDNLGFEISAVIAGLGIGGVAVALAAQAVLGDLFSYFAILFDRPFEIGDFIIVGDFMGCVDHIGIKTTRISSLGGEQLVFSNTDLTNARVRNYKRMKRRRVVFSFGVVYQTDVDVLKKIPHIVKDIIASIDNATLDRVHFAKFAASSLDYEVVYYVENGDYNLYMDCQQAINFALKEVFEKESIEFAYPTQTIYFAGDGQEGNLAWQRKEGH